jgi:hypothetical protein
MRLIRWLFAFTLIATVVTTAIAAAVPGAHRMACPTCYGLVRVAPAIFTDAPAREHAAFAARIDAARRRVARFFGPLRARPNIVLCTTHRCLAAFSSKPGRAAGVTFGWAFIRMAARGIRTDTLAHELVHAEYHWRLGLAGFFEGRVPFWFHEGLASWIADDSGARTRRFGHRQPWTRELRTEADWHAIPRRLGKLDYRYGAAAAEVRWVVDRIGVSGLQRLVQATVAGQSFDQALAAQLAR